MPRLLRRCALIGPALAAGTLAFGGAALAQVSIGQLSPDGVTVKGQVAEDFGGKFILADETGRILVEPRGGLPTEVKISPGETLTVSGVPRQRIFDATKIVRDGNVLFAETRPAADAAPPPPPPAQGFAAPPPTGVGPTQIEAALKQNGLTALGAPERKKRHIEVPARDANGTNVVASLDLFGRMWEVEDADEDDDRPVPIKVTSPAQAIEVVRQAGYQATDQVERRKHHFEVMSRNAAGEVVEVHLDLAGHIYKRVWIR